MDLVLFSVKRVCFLLRFLAAAMLVFNYGCGGDGETRLIDLSKTVAIERPEDRPAEYRPLRVAVAAMISPKETFIYHRQILDYIGRRLNRGVELVQRKTYGDINALF